MDATTTASKADELLWRYTTRHGHLIGSVQEAVRLLDRDDAERARDVLARALEQTGEGT